MATGSSRVISEMWLMSRKVRDRGCRERGGRSCRSTSRTLTISRLTRLAKSIAQSRPRARGRDCAILFANRVRREMVKVREVLLQLLPPRSRQPRSLTLRDMSHISEITLDEPVAITTDSGQIYRAEVEEGLVTIS